MKYTVYFEIFGKKMKTTVEANNEHEAQGKVISKIIWHGIVPEKTSDDDVLDFFKNTFGMK